MIYALEEYRIDTVNCLVHRDGQAVAVKPKVFDLLVYLIIHIILMQVRYSFLVTEIIDFFCTFREWIIISSQGIRNPLQYVFSGIQTVEKQIEIIIDFAVFYFLFDVNSVRHSIRTKDDYISTRHK